MVEIKYVLGKPKTQEYELIRTLVRVTKLDDLSDKLKVYAHLPSWDGGRKEVELPVENLPIHLLDLLEPNYRFMAYANIGAEREEDLYFSDFEFTPGETLKDQEKIITNFKQSL